MAPVHAQLARELDDLVRGGVAAGLVDEAGGQAHGARIDPLAHPVAHPAELRRARGALREPHRAVAQGAVAHQHRHVAARRRLVDPGHVAGEAVPSRRVGARVEAPEPLAARLEGHDAGAAIAHDVRRDALHDLERHLGIEEHGEVVVAVHVDEAGRHGEPRRVELGAAALGDDPDRGDALAAHAHVGARAGGSRPVIDRSAPDHQIIARHKSPPRPRLQCSG